MKLKFALSIAIINISISAMEKPLPRHIQPQITQDLWGQIKQRIALLKELKFRFAKSEQIIPPPMPAQMNIQSLAHLEALFGPNLSQENYISLAINDPQFPPKYKEIMQVLSKQYTQLAHTIINNEKRYWNYDVFYHGQQGALTLIHDILYAIYGWLDLELPDKQTRFLRLFTKSSKEEANVDEFLKRVQKEMNIPTLTKTEFFDHIQIVRNNLLANNLSLFGNLGEGAENSWNYFVLGASIKPPILKAQLEDFFNFFDFDKRFINPILEAHNTYIEAVIQLLPSQKEIAPGILCQIFIDPSLVDQLTYLSEGGGSMFSFEDYINAEEFASPECDEICDQMLQLQEEIFDPQLNRMSVKKYLAIMKKNPETIPPFLLNSIQARLYLKYSLLMNPEKVKIFTYKSPAINPRYAQAAEQKYKRQLNRIVEEIIKDWLFREKKKEGNKTKLERFFEFIKNR